MDVRCERCNTEYEFDDALVSGRGTTVKCTNCGHKFKIRRRDGDFSEDFWNVQTGDGRTLVFTSLRELQRAIQTNLVDRGDLLSRGGLRQKPIGQIPELAPFFDPRDPRKSLPPAPAGDPVPAARETRASRPPPPPGVTAPALAPPPRQRMSTRPDFPPEPPPRVARVGSSTLIGTGMDDSETRIAAAAAAAFGSPITGTGTGTGAGASAAALGPSEPPARAPSVAPVTEREAEAEPDTERFAEQAREARKALTRTQPLDPPPRVVDIPRHTPPPTFESSSPLPPAVPVLPTLVRDDDYEAAMRGRSSQPESHPPSTQRRRGVGGYVVAIVVLAGVALLGVVWAKDHLGGFLGKPPAPVVTTDPRVAGFLTTGEKALADGNVDLAKESFDKASALAEKDPRVLLGLARLAAVRADTAWLKSRLLAPDATDEIRSTKDSLAELSAAARKAADDALAVAPDDPAALRAKMDTLRIAGERDAARALVSKVASSGAQPETSYVLAGLDLADAEPLWSPVLERLRAAANVESGPGRGRATLAYALARSGDPSGAKAEVERLAAMARQHPLLPLLRAFAANAKLLLRVDALPDAGPPAVLADAGRVHGDRSGRPLSSDGRLLVQQGEQARTRGDLDRAQMLFAAALDRNANDTEALNGLAAIAHARRDLNGARASYKRVLSNNPGYVPALVGLGDVEFESGDRAAAMKTYKDIVDRYPDGTYPARVKQRLEGTASSSGAAPAGSGSTPTPAPSDTGGGG